MGLQVSAPFLEEFRGDQQFLLVEWLLQREQMIYAVICQKSDRKKRWYPAKDRDMVWEGTFKLHSMLELCYA